MGNTDSETDFADSETHRHSDRQTDKLIVGGPDWATGSAATELTLLQSVQPSNSATFCWGEREGEKDGEG